MKELTERKVLIVEDLSVSRSQVMRKALDALCAELKKREFQILRAASYEESRPVIANDMDIDCLLLASDMKLAPQEEAPAKCLLKLAKSRLPRVPVFLLADRAETSEAISPELLKEAGEFIWIFEDSPLFIAGRIEGAVERYRAGLLPPLMKAIWEYNEHNHEYSWAAPGHQGGRGFTKNPVGKKFYDFYDENLFRTDTGIERTSIGSLLDHTGSFAESEKEMAKTFGSHQSFSVVVGTSGSNRTVMQASLAPGDVAICDRNCHKSIEQGLMLTGAVPVYLQPTRNRYGIIGPIPPAEFEPETIQKKLGALKLPHGPEIRNYAVVTNCTYDGLCYNAGAVEKRLEHSADRIHFDEAWYAYARFNPLYKDHYAMRGDPARHGKNAPTVFATHSTHKLLAALSQASCIHIRNGRKNIPFERLNQAYMIHATTSPLYAICASNDIAARMMADNGCTLTQEVIDEAIDFRQALARLQRDFAKHNSWFFQVWNAPKVTCPKTGKVYDFADAPKELLRCNQDFWKLKPGESWHGFENIAADWAMLDPIKVSILAPGMGEDGKLCDCGVPAALVSCFIYQEGIVPTRTTDFQLMFLFSIGITKGKWVTLLNALLKFKALYDTNTPLAEALPGLAAAHPKEYANMGIRDLGQEMFGFIKENTPTAKLNAAFETLPEMVLTPRDAYMEIVRDYVELVPASQLAGRITANAVIPYPPGIPMLISGERFGSASSAQVSYLRSLADWDARFPGFEHETEGCTVLDGVYHVLCVTER